MLIIEVKDTESIDRALKNLKRKYDRAGILKELRSRKHFTKPSIKKRAPLGRLNPSLLTCLVRPPMESEASKRWTSCPCFLSVYAAEQPAAPLPITATFIILSCFQLLAEVYQQHPLILSIHQNSKYYWATNAASSRCKRLTALMMKIDIKQLQLK